MFSFAVSRTTTGIVALPARRDALQRLSPMISSNLSFSFGNERTTIGCSTPNSRIECTSSSMSAWLNSVLGWLWFGTIASRSSSLKVMPGTGTSSVSAGVLVGFPPPKKMSLGRDVSAGAVGIKAPMPRPSPPFLSAILCSSDCYFSGGLKISDRAR